MYFAWMDCSCHIEFNFDITSRRDFPGYSNWSRYTWLVFLSLIPPSFYPIMLSECFPQFLFQHLAPNNIRIQSRGINKCNNGSGIYWTWESEYIVRRECWQSREERNSPWDDQRGPPWQEIAREGQNRDTPLSNLIDGVGEYPNWKYHQSGVWTEFSAHEVFW